MKSTGKSVSREIFRKICVTLFALTHLLTTDSTELVEPAEIPHRQSYLLHMSLDEHVLHQVRGEAGEKEDVCQWAQIRCTDGIATSLWASIKRTDPRLMLSIEVEWLPPTLQFIHMYFIRVPYMWQNVCLPRDLKYLSLADCIDAYSRGKSFDFTRFPRKMEELILSNSNVRGVIRFDGLPETLRLMYLSAYHDFVKGVVVDYSRLPNALEGLYASTNMAGRSISKIKVVGKPIGVHLDTYYNPSILNEKSHYYAMFQQRLFRLT